MAVALEGEKAVSLCRSVPMTGQAHEAGVETHPVPRFSADAMLGRLARWLRACDLDTLFGPDFDDHALVRRAALDDRILLTRDRHLVEHLRPPQALLIRSQAPLAQLREVVARLELARPAGFFTRCLVCNAPLVALEPEEAVIHLPERARELSGSAFRCPHCEQLFWRGSHVRRMNEALAGAIPEWFDR